MNKCKKAGVYDPQCTDCREANEAPPTESWSERFDDEFASIFDEMGAYGVQKGIKDFIKSLLQEEREKVLRKIEQLKVSEFGDPRRPFYGTVAAINHATLQNKIIDDLLASLTKEA